MNLNQFVKFVYSWASHCALSTFADRMTQDLIPNRKVHIVQDLKNTIG